MLYREIIAGCSEVRIKHTNTLCGQNVKFLTLKLVVHIVTIGLKTVKIQCNVLLQPSLYKHL